MLDHPHAFGAAICNCLSMHCNANLTQRIASWLKLLSARTFLQNTTNSTENLATYGKCDEDAMADFMLNSYHD